MLKLVTTTILTAFLATSALAQMPKGPVDCKATESLRCGDQDL